MFLRCSASFIGRARARMEALHRRNIQEILFRTWFLGVVAIGMIATLSYGGYQGFLGRSEERRGGEEGRSRGGPYYLKKKKKSKIIRRADQKGRLTIKKKKQR